MQRIILLASLFIYQVLSPNGAFSLQETKNIQKNNEIVILTYNVRNCRGQDNRIDYQRVADIINRINPEVVALQELDSSTLRSGKIIVLA